MTIIVLFIELLMMIESSYIIHGIQISFRPPSSQTPPQTLPHDPQTHHYHHQQCTEKMQISIPHQTNPFSLDFLRSLPIFFFLPHQTPRTHIDLLIWWHLLRFCHLQLHRLPINLRLEFHHSRPCPDLIPSNRSYPFHLHVTGFTETRRCHVLFYPEGMRTCIREYWGAFDSFDGYSIWILSGFTFADNFDGCVL